MAQSGYTPILIYGSSTPSNTPSAVNLATDARGVELAVNAADGKLFYKDTGGTVQVLATKDGASGTFSNVTITGGTINGTLIGGSSPAAGTFTSLSATSLTGLTTALSVAQGGTGTTTSTGTGSVVLSASPALTGTPTAPTATTGTNTTQIATTAFVQASTGALGTMSSQNANNVAITGGTITGTTINGNVVGSNSVGARTVSTSSPTGGSDGDIWYKV